MSSGRGGLEVTRWFGGWDFEAQISQFGHYYLSRWPSPFATNGSGSLLVHFLISFHDSFYF